MINNFEKVLIAELEAIYSTEHKISEFFPEIENEIQTPDLRKLVSDGALEAKEQIGRLEKSIDILKKKSPKKSSNKAIAGLIQDTKKILKSVKEKSPLKDVVLIGALQNIKNYEASLYKSALAHAKLLKSEDVVSLLEQSLEEESTMDLVLSKIAEGTFYASGVNRKALKSET